MKLLILTQYFPPEVGAPQNRLYELAVRLKKLGVEITILTAMPNYPQMKIHAGYEDKKYCIEDMNGLIVHRASIYIPKSKSITQRLLNYFSFVYSSYKVGKRKMGDFDFLMVESPPLFLGISAYYLAKRKNAKLIFNVSDLWPESAEKLGLVTNKLFLSLAYKLESFLYRKSVLVTGQTQGICEDIKKRFPQVKTFWLPNGVDLDFYDSTKISRDWRNENNFKESDFLITYAGIHGYAQGLEVILKAANILKEVHEIKFVFVGSGPVKSNLLQLCETFKLSNVFFFETVSKDKMPSLVASTDAAVIPLRKLDLFKGAIPSKIFENIP